MTGNADVTWQQMQRHHHGVTEQQRQLQAIQHQLLLMQAGLPAAVMPTAAISQPGYNQLFSLCFVCAVFVYHCFTVNRQALKPQLTLMQCFFLAL